MELQDYLSNKKAFQHDLLHYLDDDADSDEEQKIINYIEQSPIRENRKEIKLFIKFLLVLSNNHYRSPNFFTKIEKITSLLPIKQTFTNFEIYELFSLNKRILLYIIQSEILSVDDLILFLKLNDQKSPENLNYPLITYFWPEIKNKINKNIQKTKIMRYFYHHDLLFLIKNDDTEIFSSKRKSGENDKLICQLIQKDLIEEFITYVTRNNISLSNTIIEQSIVETNTLLIENKPTLIEYSAFYGSIQIFQYLRLNNVDLKPSLWIYAIHGRNPDIIHLLEENHVNPPKNEKNQYVLSDENGMSYEICYIESIKCHHFELTEYIENNYFTLNECEQSKSDKIFVSPYSFEFYNYSYFPSNLNNHQILNYLCKYDYAALLDVYFKNIDICPNIKTKREVISNQFFI